MSATVLYLSTSLDGFIAGPNERLDNGLGDGGYRLHEWLTGAEAQSQGSARSVPRQRPGRRRVHVQRPGRRRPGNG